jgi:hypothetical protein
MEMSLRPIFFHQMFFFSYGHAFGVAYRIITLFEYF